MILKVSRERSVQSLMGTLNLTVPVLDVSPKVTRSDLNVFFSYCGTVDNIQLFRNNNQQSQLAFVTFKQPYAFKTALLLNGASTGDSPVRILALPNLAIHPVSDKRNWDTQNKEKQRFVPIVQYSAVQGIVEEDCKFWEKRRATMHQILATCAEQSAGQLGTAIMNNDYISNGTTWLSGLVDRASKKR